MKKISVILCVILVALICIFSFLSGNPKAMLMDLSHQNKVISVGSFSGNEIKISDESNDLKMTAVAVAGDSNYCRILFKIDGVDDAVFKSIDNYEKCRFYKYNISHFISKSNYQNIDFVGCKDGSLYFIFKYDERGIHGKYIKASFENLNINDENDNAIESIKGEWNLRFRLAYDVDEMKSSESINVNLYDAEWAVKDISISPFGLYYDINTSDDKTCREIMEAGEDFPKVTEQIKSELSGLVEIHLKDGSVIRNVSSDYSGSSSYEEVKYFVSYEFDSLLDVNNVDYIMLEGQKVQF
ncbi:MAG: hypothetical protein E7281_02950 [Lachnospiraceae bacterium]|nr:hypothetical protein [Lachnospiraceae bacterium]